MRTLNNSLLAILTVGVATFAASPVNAGGHKHFGIHIGHHHGHHHHHHRHHAHYPVIVNKVYVNPLYYPVNCHCFVYPGDTWATISPTARKGSGFWSAARIGIEVTSPEASSRPARAMVSPLSRCVTPGAGNVAV